MLKLSFWCVLFLAFVGCGYKKNTDVFRMLNAAEVPLYQNAQHFFPLQLHHDVYITQGMDNPDPNSSHHQKGVIDTRWAVDIRAQEGTLLFASHDGEITMAYDETTDDTCGAKEQWTKANYLVLTWIKSEGEASDAFPEGAQSVYLHLKNNSIPLIYKTAMAKGKPVMVKAGDFIGRTGKTGWTYCAPHLHYHVQKKSGICATGTPWFCDHIKITYSEKPGVIPQWQNSWPSKNPGTPLKNLPLVAKIPVQEVQLIQAQKNIELLMSQIDLLEGARGASLSSCGISSKGDLKKTCATYADVSTCMGNSLLVCGNMNNEVTAKPFLLRCNGYCQGSPDGFSDFCFNNGTQELNTGEICR